MARKKKQATPMPRVKGTIEKHGRLYRARWMVDGKYYTRSTGTADRDEADDTWRAYVSPFVFPVVGMSLEYSVVGADGHDNPRWLGTGQLNVVDCPAQGSADAPDVVPRNCYIRNPVTGLYHELTAAVDEDGNLTINLADEGVER